MSNVVKFTTDVDTRSIMSQAKFYEGYARWSEEKDRYETWNEAVERVMNMHKKYYKDRMSDELLALIKEAEDAYKEQYVLGAQRALQFGGEQLLKHQMRLFNCTSTYADRVAYFGEFLYVLLCGAGAGVSVQKHHVAKLPQIRSRKGQAKIHVIEDSIEGWATAADVLMSSFFVGGVHPEYEGRKVYFDTTKIRPKGAMISGGFKAPGPEPLRKALDKIERLLQEAVEAGQEKLKPIQVYDISMHLADAVLAGGVRRSATIFLFSFDDEEMMTAKTGDWFQKNPQRARSNNSAILVRSEVTREQFAKLMESTRQFGEPGFLFVDSTEHATNPCVTADTMVLTDQGRLPVRELIGTEFNAIVNGKSYKTTGFWKTGTKPVYLLTTSDGYSVRATSNHKILTTDGWKELKDITEEDSVVLNHNTDIIFGDDTDFEKGWLVGSFHGDGTVSGKSAKLVYWNDEIGTSSEYARSMLSKHFYTYKPFNASINEKYDGKNSSIAFESAALYRYCQEIGAIVDGRKNNLENIESMSNSFKLGYLAGMIDSDGSWQGSINRGLSLRVWQRSLKRLEQMQRLLIDLGIKSVIYKDRNRSRPNINSQLPGIKNLDPGEMNELSISGTSLVDLLKIIKLQNKKYLELYDEVKKYKRGPYQSKFASKVKSKALNGFEDVYDVTVDEVHCFDANGIIVHNCVEIGMLPQYEGVTGWQGCNLTEINGAKAINKHEFFRAIRAASILGTLQAGYTNFKFLTETTRKIFEREALLGVSITGWMNNPQVLLDEEILKEGAELVRSINESVAKLIGINPAARTTCVKPAGNASVLLKTASGVHGEHSPIYIRNVQMNKETEVAQLIKRTNPYMVEESVWSANKSDYIVSFPVIAPSNSVWREDLYGINLLEKVKLIQNTWVEYGTNTDRCVDPTVRHNVSNTVSVRDDEWDAVEEYVFENKDSFAGISFLGASGDKDFNQAPNTEILDETQIISRYGRGAIFASGLIVDATHGFDNLWDATFIAQQDEDWGDKEKADLRADWIRRFRKYADSYFEGTLEERRKKADHCLKAVHLLHRWNKIQQHLKPIDFVNNLESKKFTEIDTMAAAACVGQAGCEV